MKLKYLNAIELASTDGRGELFKLDMLFLEEGFKALTSELLEKRLSFDI